MPAAESTKNIEKDQITSQEAKVIKTVEIKPEEKKVD